MKKIPLLAAVATALVAACAVAPGPDGPQKVVIKVTSFLATGGPAPVHEILDLGLPPIHNLSNSTVRLRSVQLISAPADVHVLNVRAYEWRRVGVGWLMNAFGDLPRQCPSEFVPQPVTAVVTAPHSDSGWIVIIALTISRPGTYHLRKVKITYVADGQRGWQYQDLNATISAFRGSFPKSGC